MIGRNCLILAFCTKWALFSNPLTFVGVYCVSISGVQFVQRNRVDSSRLTMTSLGQIHSTLDQRVKLVHGRHSALMSKERGELDLKTLLPVHAAEVEIVSPSLLVIPLSLLLPPFIFLPHSVLPLPHLYISFLISLLPFTSSHCVTIAPSPFPLSEEDMFGGSLEEGMERTIILKCYSKVTVSSSDRGKDK